MVSDPHFKTSSRRTLLEQLTAGHSNRIKWLVDLAYPNEQVPPPPRPRLTLAKHTAEAGDHANSRSSLIPPIEFLPPAPQSADSPPPPQPDLLFPEPGSVDKHISSDPSRKSMTAMPSGTPELLLPTSPVSPQVGTSGVTILQTWPRPYPSPPLCLRPPDLSLTQTLDALSPQGPSQPQEEPGPVTLHQPYRAQEPSLSGMNGNINDVPMDTDSNDSALAVTTSSSTLTREFQAQTRNILEAVRNISDVFGAAHRAQIETEHALALQIGALQDQRATFARQKKAEEAALQAEFRPATTREEERKARRAKLQAEDVERRAQDEKRMQEVQEQIARALEELEELKTMRAEGRFEERGQGAVPEDLPTEPQEGMSEEEVRAIGQRNNAIERIHRMHEQNVKMLEESTSRLRRLQKQKRQREAEEAERRRITEERLLAEAERARQAAEEEKQRHREAAEALAVRQTQHLADQQAHAEAEAHSLRQKEAFTATPDQESDERRQDNGGGSELSPNGVPGQIPTEAPQQAASSSKSKKDVPISGGVMLSASYFQNQWTSERRKARTPLPASAKHLPSSLRRQKRDDRSKPTHLFSPSSSLQSPIPTSENAFSANTRLSLTPPSGRKPPFTPNLKSQTLLDPSGSVNLRHLKKSRNRIEENGSGDRSARKPSVKSEGSVILKMEEHDDQPLPHEPERTVTSPSQHDTATGEMKRAHIPLPARPAVIPPPRPRISMKPASKPTSSHPSQTTESHELPFTGGEAEAANVEQPQYTPASFPRASPSPWVMDAAAAPQEWAPVLTPPPPPETSNPMLLNRFDNLEAQEQISNVMQARPPSPEPPSAILSRENRRGGSPQEQTQIVGRKPQENQEECRPLLSTPTICSISIPHAFLTTVLSSTWYLLAPTECGENDPLNQMMTNVSTDLVGRGAMCGCPTIVIRIESPGSLPGTEKDGLTTPS
ncbi:hypothetical protein BU15DRAFT_73224 [Melanogaster broomeanus]|nr:hypothetical protein BU15DRAFT_73224 [Melanogaster broomeanus]